MKNNFNSASEALNFCANVKTRISVKANTIREAMEVARGKGFDAYCARESAMLGYFWVFDIDGYLFDEMAAECRLNY